MIKLEREARAAAVQFANSHTFAIAFNQRLREYLEELEAATPKDEDTIANLRLHLGLSVGVPGAPPPGSARRKKRRKKGRRYGGMKMANTDEQNTESGTIYPTRILEERLVYPDGSPIEEWGPSRLPDWVRPRPETDAEWRIAVRELNARAKADGSDLRYRSVPDER
jgi:hypothetical protein